MQKDNHKELYLPGADIVQNAVVSNPDDLYRRASEDLEGFREYTGKRGTLFLQFGASRWS